MEQSSLRLPPTPEQLDRGVQVTLAEFGALRDEILNLASAQAALLGVGLTALGVIVGFAVGEDGDLSLLLGVPPVALFISVLRAGQSYRVALVGEYIRNRVWPYLRERVYLDASDGWLSLPSWQDEVSERWRDWGRPAGLIDWGASALFFVASVVALGWLAAAADEVAFSVGWWLGVVATFLALLFPAIVGEKSRKLALAGGHKGQRPPPRDHGAGRA